MKVLIVAKTRQGKAACIGGITFAGQSVRLVAPDQATNESAGMEYNVGDVWEIEATPAETILPPHVENIIVHAKRKLPPLEEPIAFIEQHLPPRCGGPEVLYEGLTQAIHSGPLYIAEQSGIPPYSTMFWRPDQPLQRDEESKRIRYRYPTADGGRTLTFVGFQEPLLTIPANTLLRVSLAHWWRPQDKPDVPLRCFVQLSGWFLPQETNDWPFEDDNYEPYFSIESLPFVERGAWNAEPEEESAEEGYSREVIPARTSAGTQRNPRNVARPANPKSKIQNPQSTNPPIPASSSSSHSSLLTPHPSLSDAQRLLKTIFGYDNFRPLQAEIITNILNRQDTLAIMPTGSGKSLCYQLPALLFSGLTVVVSPLISLMQDQVEQLRELGVSAVFLNSTLDYDTYLSTTHLIRRGEVKLLYVAPETLLRPETLALLEQCQVECLTIDEAHCISSWGHDFRPEYRQLLAARRRFARAVCFALTATATGRVRADIQESLGLAAGNEFIASFNRDNLYLAVARRSDGLTQTLAFLENHRHDSGIIYCSTRRQVDTLTAQLNALGWSALPYHAGLDDATRRRNQNQFSRDDVPIMVATVAFGMGINKSNVRFILHYNLPKNIESYYQEIGRAGRDGLPADCLLLYSPQDTMTISGFIEGSAPSERAGQHARLQAILRYVETDQCRRRPLLDYFGESFTAGSCALCDNCQAPADSREKVDVTVPAQKFFSCVKRTGEMFGMTHIINILRGSKNQKLLTSKHDQLSTYGIGMEYSADQWKQLAHQWIEQGYLTQDMQYGSLRLTAKGSQVLKKEESVYATMERPRQHITTTQLEYDTALFEELRRLRRQLAQEANIAPYMIFSDRALLEMARYFPQSPGRFLDINGVGQTKLEHYGDAFLDLLRAYCQPRNLAEIVKPSIPPGITTAAPKKRRFEEMGELFTAGQSIQQLQAIYNVKVGTVVSNLHEYLQAGHEIEPGRVLLASQLTAEQQAHILNLLDELGPTRLRPLYDALNETVSWDELHIMRLYYLSRQ
jgi:ATP-dependent DNA helicase RecQ